MMLLCCASFLALRGEQYQTCYLFRRYLRARKWDIPKAKKMFKESQEWRRTVEGVGIDRLYNDNNPWEVSSFL
jgi:hypothetical protein